MSIGIFDYALRNGLQIKFGKTLPSVDERWYATLDTKGDKLVEYKNGPSDPVLTTAVDFGSSKLDAVNKLCKTLRGKLLVVQDYGGLNRVEQRVPTNLQYATSL